MQSISESDKHFKDLISNSKSKVVLQPIVVAVCEDELGLAVHRAYIYIEGQRVFDFDTVIEAVHFCMLIIWYFNYNYQEESRNIWSLLQLLFYRFGNPESLPAPTLATHVAITQATINKPWLALPD